ncbi:hypothetical protein EV702DRAFT_758032 [Suillus placidus]|uniref:Uncharacterized protein n=1 Tax=Suillus placidus TaxID=48579 RepID=A0A9P7CW30_9AGAM|nr:hypothetical protein EV702DRAFT_758032 [Suillus placidus]
MHLGSMVLIFMNSRSYATRCLFSRVRNMLNPCVFVVWLDIPIPVLTNRGIAEGELTPLKNTERASQDVLSLSCLELSHFAMSRLAGRRSIVSGVWLFLSIRLT